MRISTTWILSALTATMLTGWAPAEDPAITRLDLARSYLRFEQAVEKRPPSQERFPEINRRFDEATLQFFAREKVGTLRSIDALTASLDDGNVTPEEKLAFSLRITCDPVTYVDAKRGTVQVRSLYPVDLDQDVETTVRIGEPAVATFSFVAKSGKSVRVEKEFEFESPESLSLGRSPIVVSAGPVTYEPTWVYRSQRSLDEQRDENATKLAEIEATPPLEHAIAICQARIGLLADTPDIALSTAVLVDQTALAVEVANEIAALREGRNPYRNRPGDYWRVVPTGSRPIPVRVLAPESVREDEPVPLLVALHGAGGDENMFLDGYGAGRIGTIAKEHGLLLATPVSYGFALTPAPFDDLLESLEKDYRIDRDRIYVLGHSLGAVGTSNIATLRSDKVAATCMLAGAGRSTRFRSMAPTLIAAGGNDPIVSASRVREYFEAARDAGMPVEFRSLPDHGHTLIVGAMLDPAIDWLLEHSREQGASE